VPTYQYACTACGEQHEAVQSFTDAPLTECPACGGRLRKVYSAVGVVFKGSGFYKNDSRSTGKGSAPARARARPPRARAEPPPPRRAARAAPPRARARQAGARQERQRPGQERQRVGREAGHQERLAHRGAGVRVRGRGCGRGATGGAAA
jgi:putative FmdB family regulatory protein